jgi:hypothetical protein
MPNWVDNWVGISGTEADLTAFLEKAGKPYPTKHSNYNPETKEYEQVDATNESPFSFWNFIEPEDKEAYFGSPSGNKPEGYEGWTSEQKMAHDLKFTGNGWYDWNVRNWGTKWDANDVNVDEVVTDGKGNASVSITFNTAWSIPEPIFKAMVEQHQTLSFDFECEEEQGWGAKFTATDEDGERSLTMIEEWDIPDCHADYDSRGRECVCSWDDDEENWYEDCPALVKEFAVVVSRTYSIKATSAERAWELAQDQLLNGEGNLPDGVEVLDEDTVFVKDLLTNERIFPTTVEGEVVEKVCNHHYVPVSTSKDGVIVDTGYTQCVHCNDKIIKDGVEV